MKWLALLAIATLMAPPAFAHGDGPPISPAELWHHWSFDPLVWLPLLVAHWLYGRGVARAWARAGIGRIISRWRLGCFMAGEVTLAVALISPLDPLGETLLSAHMAQHILLTAVAPPLLLLGSPILVWTWAMPATWRSIGASPAVRTASRLLNWLCRPLIASLIASGVLWMWHVPTLFETALEDEVVHTLEHLTFFAAALLGWQAALSPYVSAVAAASVTLIVFMAGGMLGGVLSLAPVVLYDWYGNRALLWGITPLQDQQLAGLLMWVLAGGVYLAAFVGLAVRVAAPGGAGRSRPSHGIMRDSTSSRSTK